jgi:hypothetical protein
MILNSWQENMDGQTIELKKNFSCKYCDKEFRKESTLAAHLCENKRRWQQEKETGVQFGLRAYLQFYETTQGSAKLKTYEHFATSSFYTAFVKFGRHLVNIRAVNTQAFIDWLLKNNKKLDHWCKDTNYNEWLLTYTKKEAVQDALERSLKEMQDYADTNQQLQGNFVNYFRHGGSNRICQHIANGRVSAWVVYNSDSGVAWLDTLNEEQISIIIPWIDPDFWQQRFKDYAADTEWVKDILNKAGL